jgi:hypothetical protein
MMGLGQLLMLVEEVLFVMGLRLLLVCDNGEKCEIGESDEDVESGKDERAHKNRKFRLTERSNTRLGIGTFTHGPHIVSM